MKILVTGSEGTLGTRLVPQLRFEGHDVWGCDLQHSGSEQTLRADVANHRELAAVFEQVKPDYVYHLAAEFGRLNGEGWYEQLWTTNAIGTRNVLELCRRHDSYMIFASSSEIYGEVKQDILTEDLSLTEPLFQPNEYALSKWVNEVQIKNFAAKHDDFPRPIVCRFFNAYGPGEKYHDYRSVVALFCYRALHGMDFTVYKGYHRTFMFIDDFIPTLTNVGKYGKPGETYNIGGRDYRSVEDVYSIILEEVGDTRSEVTVLGEDEHNVVSKKPSIEKAEQDLGHDPKVTIEEGVPITLNWMRLYYGLGT